MPNYDYYCDECKTTIEIFHSMKEDKKYTCGVCANRLRKIISGGVGFILKGAGFHKNDYPKKGG